MKTNNVAVIAAHPDDELLGCAGALISHIERGDTVHVMIMAQGIVSRSTESQSGTINQQLEALKQCTHNAHAMIGTQSITFCDMPDNQMDTVSRLAVTQDVEAFVAKRQPNIIYTHHPSDVNIDHKRTYEAVITACRGLPDNAVDTILCFETVSSTEWQPPLTHQSFSPNWYHPLTDSQLEQKLAALAQYDSEMRDWPHARSYQAIRALAQWRGANVGHQAAEAFALARHINR